PVAAARPDHRPDGRPQGLGRGLVPAAAGGPRRRVGAGTGHRLPSPPRVLTRVRPTAERGRRPVTEDAALPLRLPVLPALPGRVLPEFSVPCVGAFDDPDFRFSIDWDGARTLLFASPGAIRLQSETLADVSDRFPEIPAAALPLAPRSAVIDGVVAVLDPSGCPDLVALGERMAL